LNILTGKNYRLPTEVEWEYAARANENYKFSGSNIIDEVAWYEGNSNLKTHPVGNKAPNDFGLYDMNGNVWEWCIDWFKGYPGSQVNDYTGTYRVTRGGCVGNKARFCRVTTRTNYGINFH